MLGHKLSIDNAVSATRGLEPKTSEHAKNRNVQSGSHSYIFICQKQVFFAHSHWTNFAFSYIEPILKDLNIKKLSPSNASKFISSCVQMSSLLTRVLGSVEVVLSVVSGSSALFPQSTFTLFLIQTQSQERLYLY